MNFLPLLAILTSTSAPAPITVDPNVKYQKWDGWGTSLCWWAHVVGGYAPEVREDVCQRAFKYLRLNIVRYNIGGGENPTHTHMQPRALVPSFLRLDGTYDWTADANQRWVLKRAKELGANRYEAFSNSPPYFMTLNGCASGAKNGGTNLDPAKRQDFARFMVEVVKHFKQKWGITFETLEPLNEPSADWWKENGRQEGCHVSPGADQSALIEATADELEKAKLKTTVAASDESIIDQAVVALERMTDSAKARLGRINTHTYGGSKRKELQVEVDKAKKPFWMSEYGDNDASGITMSLRILKDLKDMHPSAWCYWQVVDTPGSGWGFLEMDLNKGVQTYTVTPKYYVMANYSRFIRPGAQIIDVADPNTLAALAKDTLTLVTTNKGPEKTVSFDFSKFRKVGSQAELFTTAHGKELAPTSAPVNGPLELPLPANSVTTIVIKGCRP